MYTSRASRVAVLVAALGLTAAAVRAGAQTEHRTLAGDRVAIYNLAGHLRIQAIAGSQVTVDMTRGGRDAAQLKLADGAVRGWNAFRVIYPGDRIVYGEMDARSRTELRVNADGTFDDKSDDHNSSSRDRVEIRGSGSGLDAHADLVVGVPKGQRLAVHWGVGEATITNVDGDIRVSVASARVTSEHTRGQLTLDTGSGGVTVTDAQGDVTLDTGSGGVTVNGVRGETLSIDTGSGSMSGGDIDVKTLKADVGSGGIRLARVTAQRVSLDAGSGGTDVGFASVVDDITVDAGSGGVTLRLAAAQTATVDIETGSGGIESDFAVSTTRLARNALYGRIGDGKGRIKIDAGSGRVRLLKN